MHHSEDCAAAGLPLAAPALLTLLGAEGGAIVHVAPIAQRSRNRLYRLTLDAAPLASCILKVVRQADDPFWDHHLRREHWLLNLLARFWPGGAPRAYAAAFGPGWGLLLSEDAGSRSLAELAASAGEADAHATLAEQLRATVERVAALHTALRAHERIFRRVCASVELDRMTSNALVSRLRVARERLAGGQPRMLSRALLNVYRREVVWPLVSGRRQMIHNSLSPLNVVLGAAPRLVDWETMAYAAPEFDLAELLRYPGLGLDWQAVEALVRPALGAAIDPARLRLAALARAIDYAGSNALQRRRALAEGDVERATQTGARLRWYLDEAERLARDIGVADVLADVAAPARAELDAAPGA